MPNSTLKQMKKVTEKVNELVILIKSIQPLTYDVQMYIFIKLVYSHLTKSIRIL